MGESSGIGNDFLRNLPEKVTLKLSFKDRSELSWLNSCMSGWSHPCGKKDVCDGLDGKELNVIPVKGGNCSAREE